MPREIYLTNHLNADELKQKYLKSRDPVESRRWHLLWKVSMGWSIKNSAIAVGVSYTYGKKIVKKYNELGEEGVKNIKNKTRQQLGGKKPLLTEEQQDKLKKELETRPSDGGIWTGPKVARWIEKETGVEKVWNQRGWDYLKKFRYSCQSPRPKSPNASPSEQAQFIKNLPLKVKELEKRYPNVEIDLWFFDEHRVGLKPIIRKVWAKIGERPIALARQRYEWLYVYGFVKPKTGETLWYLIPRVNTKWLNLVYENFALDAGISKKKSFVSRR